MDVKHTLFGGMLFAMCAADVLAPSAAFAGEPPPPVMSQSNPDTGNKGSPPADAKPAMRPETPPAPEPTLVAADEALSRIIDRPHTVAELEAGIIALPNAPIAGQVGGDVPIVGTVGHGDATVQTGLHVLYRWNRHFAAGAGVLFSPSTKSVSRNVKQGLGLPDLMRTHARSYFFIGGEGRYIPLHYRFMEAWVGVSVGGVVVADRYTTDAGDEVPTIIGTKEVTVRTEGFAFGAQLGGNYFLSENWIAGLNFRAYTWVLPGQSRCSPIGDCATLSGTVEALELGLTIGFRLPL